MYRIQWICILYSVFVKSTIYGWESEYSDSNDLYPDSGISFYSLSAVSTTMSPIQIEELLMTNATNKSSLDDLHRYNYDLHSIEKELSTRAAYFYPSRFKKHPLACDDNYQCKGDNERCDFDSHCACLPYYQYVDHKNRSDNNCQMCPKEGQACTDCCSDSKLDCINGFCTRCVTDEDYYVCDPKSVIFVTASQVALLAALIMGIAALATLLYRICTRPNIFSDRYDDGDRDNRDTPFQRMSRASLTSIQIRVMARLCDRPPKYESQSNYLNRTQQDQQLQPEQQDQQQQQSRLSIIESTEDIHCVGNLPPPAYDGERIEINELPPSYMETMAIPSTTGNITSTTATNPCDSRPNGSVVQLSIINETIAECSSQENTLEQRDSKEPCQSSNTSHNNNNNNQSQLDIDKVVHI